MAESPAAEDPAAEPAATASSPASEIKSEFLAAFGIGYGNWGGAADLAPIPADYISENSGPFETDAIGVELTFHGRVKSISRVAWFVGLGVGFPLGGGVGGLRLDGRAHFFDFGQLGYLFPGQSANGPMYTVALAWDFGLR